jgi:hypothetical protein
VLGLAATACGVCLSERSVRIEVAADVARSRGVRLDDGGLPGRAAGAMRARDIDESDLAVDGTPVCGKLCPPGGPHALCYVVPAEGGALSVDCRDHPPCE